MKRAVTELKRLDQELRIADPGDVDQLREIIARRAQWVAELERAVAHNGCSEAEAAQLMSQLQIISDGGVNTYRRLMLHRLLLQQRIAVLSQDRAVLRAFTPTMSA
jgi:hypothetical protein